MNTASGLDQIVEGVFHETTLASLVAIRRIRAFNKLLLGEIDIFALNVVLDVIVRLDDSISSESPA